MKKYIRKFLKPNTNEGTTVTVITGKLVVGWKLYENISSAQIL